MALKLFHHLQGRKWGCLMALIVVFASSQSMYWFNTCLISHLRRASQVEGWVEETPEVTPWATLSGEASVLPCSLRSTSMCPPATRSPLTRAPRALCYWRRSLTGCSVWSVRAVSRVLCCLSPPPLCRSPSPCPARRSVRASRRWWAGPGTWRWPRWASGARPSASRPGPSLSSCTRPRWPCPARLLTSLCSRMTSELVTTSRSPPTILP